jgi:hypothetical protein
MATELEERLSSLEKELADAKKALSPHDKRTASLRTKLLIGGFVCLVIAGGVILFMHLRQKRFASPIPASISRQVTYDLYYPSPPPTGFTLDPNSITYSGGMVSFKLQSGTKQISVIEQPLPATNLHLDSAVGLNAVDSPNGKAYVGKDKAVPAGIVTAKNTLINVSGTSDIPDDAIGNTVQNLKLVQR